VYKLDCDVHGVGSTAAVTERVQRGTVIERRGQRTRACLDAVSHVGKQRFDRLGTLVRLAMDRVAKRGHDARLPYAK
jgi:hypothetical protein